MSLKKDTEKELEWYTNEKPRVDIPVPEKKKQEIKKERPIRKPKKPVIKIPRKSR